MRVCMYKQINGMMRQIIHVERKFQVYGGHSHPSGESRHYSLLNGGGGVTLLLKCGLHMVNLFNCVEREPELLCWANIGKVP